MAEINTVIAEASQDLQTIEDFVNLPADSEVYPRLLPSVNVGTLAGTRQAIFEAGGLPATPFTTKALMTASALVDGKYAMVTDGGVDNGLYVKTAGAWVKSAYDPTLVAKTYAANLSASLSSIGRWLTEGSKKDVASLGESSNKYLVARAIKKVAVLTPEDGRDYYVRLVHKNTPNTGGRITIQDDTQLSGGLAWASMTIPLVNSVSGIQEYTITGESDRMARVVIDWDVLPDNFQETAMGLGIDNTVSLDDSLNNIATKENTTTIKKMLEAGAKIIPDWLMPSQEELVAKEDDTYRNAINNILGIDIVGGAPDVIYRIGTISKQDPTYGTRITISRASPASGQVMSYNAPASEVKKGIETIILSESSSSGMSGTATVNWDNLEDGVSVSNGNHLLIKPDSVNYAKSYNLAINNAYELEGIKEILGSMDAAKVGVRLPSKPYRVSVAGSSITWGNGFLGEDSYVGVVEYILRNQYADTIHASKLTPEALTLTGNDFYMGSAKRVSGIGEEVEFTLEGDELSLSIMRERENAGACNVELYIDNELYDVFDTSTTPSITRTEVFTGDGEALWFDLADCFTYNHEVTVGGVTKSGSINTQGTSAEIPSGDDYMVVRRHDKDNNRVVHSVLFKTAPVGSISVTYKFGENIRHLRGSIDRSGSGLLTPLESSRGLGGSGDTAQVGNISSNIDFRQSDERSVKTWRFTESKSRRFKLKIKSLHSSSTGSTAYMDINFVTNRMHHIQNAGIGGHSAIGLLQNSSNLRSIDYIINYNPDIVLIESSTNDDSSSTQYKAYVTKSGLTAEQVKSTPSALYYTSISGAVDNKTVNDIRLPMVEISSKVIKLSPDVVDTHVEAGDIIVIGEYGGSHERMTVRVISEYNPSTKEVTLNRTISADDFKQVSSLNELLSEHCCIMNAETWVNNVNALIDKVLEALPECSIHIATAGAPNVYSRSLLGYKELAQRLAREKGVGFVDYHAATYNHLYNQKLVTHQTFTSTGADSYSINRTTYIIANPVIFVDGVVHVKSRILGGLGPNWTNSVTNPTLSNVSRIEHPFTLVFDEDTPPSGAVIEIKKSKDIWARDYTHPDDPHGFYVLGVAASKILHDVK